MYECDVGLASGVTNLTRKAQIRQGISSCKPHCIAKDVLITLTVIIAGQSNAKLLVCNTAELRTEPEDKATKMRIGLCYEPHYKVLFGRFSFFLLSVLVARNKKKL